MKIRSTAKKKKKQLRKIENSLGKIENNLDILSKIDLTKEQNLYFDSNSKEIRLDDHKFINKKNAGDDKLKSLNKFAKFNYNYFKHNSW